MGPDGIPTVSFKLSLDQITEDNPLYQLTLVLESGDANHLAAHSSDLILTVSGGSATGGGTDYSIDLNSLSPTSGSNEIVVPITIQNDGIIEGSESVELRLHSSSNQVKVGSVSEFTLTIQDDVESVTVSPFFTNAPDWNDYVRAGATTVSCDGTETGSYFSCLHGGERRKVVLPNVSSCTGLTAADDLGVFNWTCDDSLEAQAYFYSSGFKENKGLRDLLDPTSFKDNRVQISKASQVIAQSMAVAWWSNVVEQLPDNSSSSVASLSSAGNIYTLSATRPSLGYNIGNNKIAIVTLGSAKLQTAAGFVDNCLDSGLLGATTSILVCSGGRDFLWVEANLEKGSTDIDTLLYLSYGADSTVFSRVHNSTFFSDGASTVGFNNDTVLYSYYSNLRISVPGTGFWLWNSDNNIIDSAYISTEVSSAYKLDSGSNFNTLKNFYLTNSSRGIDHQTASGSNVFVQGVIANSNTPNEHYSGSHTYHSMTVTNFTSDDGFCLNAYSNNTLVNPLVMNGSAGAIWISSGSNNQVYDLASYSNQTYPVYISTGSNNLFRGSMTIGDNGNSCSIGGTGNEVDNTCAYGPSLTSPTTGADFSSSVFAKVTSDDAANLSDVSGTRLFTAITDWLNFDNLFRGWGKGSANAWPPSNSVATNRGACTSGDTCQIYDWRLQSADTAAKDYFGVFSADSPCPSSVDASTSTNVITDAIGNTFLLHAVEVIGMNGPDGLATGDQDGLCESNETCLFTGNRGAYQGSGDYLSAGKCQFTDGAGVSQVNLYGYPVTGE